MPVEFGTDTVSEVAAARVEKSTVVPTAAPGTLQGLMTNLSSLTAISANARTYIEQLEKEITNASADRIKGIVKKEISLPGCIAFVHNNRAYLIVLAESVNIGAPGKLPTAMVIREAVDSLHRSSLTATEVAGKAELSNKGIRTMNSIVIEPEDYPYAQTLAHIIVKEFFCTGNADVNLTLDMLATEQYTVDCNLDNVRNYIYANSPHAVKSRVDIGFVLSMKNRDRNNYGLPQNSFALAAAQATPMLAVGGYVDFVEVPRQQVSGPYSYMQQSTEPMFLPTINITAIESDIRSPQALIPAIAIAAEMFIRSRGWVTQFNNFAKGVPNLGNLITQKDENGNVVPFHIQDMQARDTFVNMWCTMPQLVLRISEGRSRLPGLASLIDPSHESLANMNTLLANFFNSKSVVLSKPIAQVLAQVITGSIMMNGDRVDSRKLDYLQAIAVGSNIPDTGYLKFFDMDPSRRADLITSLANGNFTRRYLDLAAVLDWGFICSAVAAIAGRLNITGGNQQTQGVDMAPMLAQMQAQLSQPLQPMQTMFAQGMNGGIAMAAPYYYTV